MGGDRGTIRAVIILCLLGGGASSQVRVKRCCEAGQSVSGESSVPGCGETQHGDIPLPAVLGLNLSGRSRNVEIELTEAADRGLPECPAEMEAHTVSMDGTVDPAAWITTEGKLVTGRYESEFPHGEFCLDYTMEDSKTLVAVMCNPCKGQLPCIPLCCPHGQAMVSADDYSQVCEEQLDGVEYHKQVWDGEGRMLAWERNKHYILVAPHSVGGGGNATTGFSCPEAGKDKYLRSWADEEVSQYRILRNGSLQGLNIPHYSTGGVVSTINSSWSPDLYCLVVGTLPDYDYGEGSGETEDTGDFTETFMTCYDTDPYNWCKEFTSTFHPAALLISIVFLLLTLAAYILEPKLRESITGKITLCFVANLALCFILAVCGWFETATRGTALCVLSGYLILYLFLSFFFWLNALAINIYLLNFYGGSFSFLTFSIYAQGSPVFLCAITAIVDSTGPEYQSERLARPNMGVYRCFLGAEHTVPTRSYFKHPNFIYFHSVVLLLQVVNLMVLCMSTARMCKSRPESGFRTKMKDNFDRFTKLFIILGFYWTGDILSSALETEYGFLETCAVRIVADLAGLFSGVLIFAVLVLNKPVRTMLLDRVRGVRRTEEEQKSMEDMEDTRVD